MVRTLKLIGHKTIYLACHRMRPRWLTIEREERRFESSVFKHSDVKLATDIPTKTKRNQFQKVETIWADFSEIYNKFLTSNP